MRRLESDANRRADADHGSRRLLKALLRYGLTNGLPNLGMAQIRIRLQNLNPHRPYNGTPESVEAYLDALSRTRALNLEESLALEWAISEQAVNGRRLNGKYVSLRSRIEDLDLANRLEDEMHGDDLALDEMSADDAVRYLAHQ